MKLVSNIKKALQIVIKQKNQIVVVPKLTNYTTNKYLFSSKRDEKEAVAILKLLLEISNQQFSLKLLLEIDNHQFKLEYYSLSYEKRELEFLLFWDKSQKESDIKPFFINLTQKNNETSDFSINPTQKEDDTKPFFSNRTKKK